MRYPQPTRRRDAISSGETEPILVGIREGTRRTTRHGQDRTRDQDPQRRERMAAPARPSAAPTTRAPRSGSRNARRIWWGDWVCVGRDEEVPQPGDYIVRDIAGESIFIVRNAAGELHGFYNVCSHRGTKFLDDAEGTQNVRKAFVCPYHAWTYDLNGELVGSPNVKEDEQFDRADHPLYDFASTPMPGFMFVNLTIGGPKETLLESLTDGAESRSPCSTGSRWTSSVSACGSSTRSRRTGRSSSRTTTSASTARRSIPSSCRSSRCSASVRSGTRRPATTATGCARVRPASR